MPSSHSIFQDMKALAIDDEALARRELARLLQTQRPGWKMLEAASVHEAMPVLEDGSPSVIFLDIEMPGADGFTLLERRGESLPPVIIVSAHSHHAVRAFEFRVLDYLLKPIEPDRLEASLRRLEETIAPEQGGGDGEPVRQLGDHLLISEATRCWFVALKDIAGIESDGNYVRLLGPTGHPMVPRSLDYFEARLDPKVYFRANRRMIINIHRINGLKRLPGGHYAAEVAGLGAVEFSRRQSQEFRQRFGF